MRSSEKLHKRLLSLGFDVNRPKRIWIGRNPGGDMWKWQATVRGTGGLTHIGCTESMADCLDQKDDILEKWVDTEFTEIYQ